MSALIRREAPYSHSGNTRYVYHRAKRHSGHRQRQPMDPTTSPENLPPRVIALVVGLSLLGGLAHFVNKLRRGTVRVHWLLELAGDCLYSLAAGFSAWYLATAVHLGEYAAASVAIVAGHLGARLIWLLQGTLLDRLDAWIRGPSDPTDRAGF